MEESPKAVVLILNYDGLRALGGALFESIESALNINYENLDVVVVDNGSSDGSDTEVESRFRGDVTLIRLGKNYGYAGGNELGFRRYVKEKGIPGYLAIMNNDYILKNPDFLGKAVKMLEAEERTVLAQGINLLRDGRRIESAGIFIDATLLTVISRCRGLSPSECPERPSYTTHASGAFFIIKVRPVLLTRGLIFRPELFLQWEETELALNMWSHGYRCLAVPELAGIHMGSMTAKHSKQPMIYYYFRNMFTIYKDLLSPYLRARYARLSLLAPARYSASCLLIGERRAIPYIWRGAIDSFFFKKITKTVRGSYEPLLLVPKLLWIRALLPKRASLKDLTTLVIDKNLLMSGARPFLVHVS